MKSNQSPTILVLGASLMQAPAYEAALRRGWRAIAVDRDPQSTSIPLASGFIQADISNAAEVMERAREYAALNRVDGVFTCGTDFSHTVALTAQNLGLPGMPPEVALLASDKELMRERFHAAGVPCPQHRVLAAEPVTDNQSRFSTEALAEIAQSLGLPVVVKPVDNMGARGVRLARDRTELKHAAAYAATQSRSGRVIFEQGIDGCEYSIDALVFDGRIVITGVADRHIFFLPYFVELGHTIPTELRGHEYETLIEGFRNAVRALGIEFGAAKGDVFMSQGQAVVGEIAARLSGGYMSGWTFPAASGFELVEAGMELALGISPSSIPPHINDLQPKRYTAERAWISIPGRIQSLSGLPDSALGLGKVKEQGHGLVACFPRALAGDEVQFPTNNVEKCGNILYCGQSREQAVRAAEDLTQSVCIRLEPGHARTMEFLFGEQGRKLPWYLSLENSDNLQAVKEMPPFGRFSTQTTQPSYLPIPYPERELLRGWDGLGVVELLDRLQNRLSIAPHNAAATVTHKQSDASAQAGHWVLGAIFWRALAKGGLQAALFLIDTVSRGVHTTEELARLTGTAWHQDIFG